MTLRAGGRGTGMSRHLGVHRAHDQTSLLTTRHLGLSTIAEECRIHYALDSQIERASNRSGNTRFCILSRSPPSRSSRSTQRHGTIVPQLPVGGLGEFEARMLVQIACPSLRVSSGASRVRCSRLLLLYLLEEPFKAWLAQGVSASVPSLLDVHWEEPFVTDAPV